MTQPVIIGNATLYLGDCRDVLSTLKDHPAVVLTDPPFGIGYQSGQREAGLWKAGKRITNDHDTTCRDEALAMLAGIPALVFGSRKAPLPPGTRARHSGWARSTCRGSRATRKST
jgi:hypothetical protein